MDPLRVSNSQAEIAPLSARFSRLTSPGETLVTPASGARLSAWTLPFLGLILLLGLGLRAYGGITWGLPDRFHPDEHFIMDPAVKMLATGDPNPRWFNYPSLYMYLQAAVEPVGRPLQPIIDSHYEAEPDALVQARQLAVGRTLTVIIATLSILGVFALGRRSYGIIAGLAGAALIAIHGPHIANSQWVTTDVPASAAVLSTALCSICALQKKSSSCLIAGAIAAGMSAGLKYNAGIAVVMPLAALFLTWRGVYLVRNFVIVGVAAMMAFLVSTPFALLDFHKFTTDLQFEINHYSTGHAGAEGSDTWRWYVSTFLFSSPFAGLVGGAGIIYAAIRHRKEDIVLLSFVIVYYCLIAPQVVRFERNLMPLVPIACVLGGRLAQDLIGFFSSRRIPKVAVLAPIGGLVLVVGISATDAFARDQVLAARDSRHVAQDWALANLPPGARITKEFYSPTLTSAFAVKAYWGLYQVKYDDLVCKSDYLIASGGIFDRYFVASDLYPDRRQFYEKLFELPVIQDVNADLSQPGPHILILRVPREACPSTKR
jgi:4-amino-4-deoxy-L-arabinose transferase-like glycosyltransferase